MSRDDYSESYGDDYSAYGEDDTPYNSNDSCYDPNYEAAYYGRIPKRRKR